MTYIIHQIDNGKFNKYTVSDEVGSSYADMSDRELETYGVTLIEYDSPDVGLIEVRRPYGEE